MSCDRTPLEYFLYCHAKSRVFADKSVAIGALEAYILCVICNMWSAIFEKVTQNWMSRMRFVSRGRHMPEVTFKC